MAVAEAEAALLPLALSPYFAKLAVAVADLFLPPSPLLHFRCVRLSAAAVRRELRTRRHLPSAKVGKELSLSPRSFSSRIKIFHLIFNLSLLNSF